MHETRKIEVYNLTCDMERNPLGIDAVKPMLGWKLSGSFRGIRQQSYRIIVSRQKDALDTSNCDLWDSGLIHSDESIQIEYRGTELSSGERAYWKVEVWDQEGNYAVSEEQAYWETGLMKLSDWGGEWIGLANRHIPGWSPLFRKKFRLISDVKKARIYVCGLGYYELSINGKKVGNRVLDPAQTDYQERVMYAAYDITAELCQGDHVLGIMLGDGFYSQNRVWGGTMAYGPPCLLVQMNVMLQDGSQIRLFTNGTWKAANGPITLNNVYAGETYDARLEQEGWDRPEFDDADWFYAMPVIGPSGVLSAQTIPPIRVKEQIRPTAIHQPRGGTYVYDLGRNIAGWVRLQVQGPAGSEVSLRFAEDIDEFGMIDTNSGGSQHTNVLQCDRYILEGTNTEVWEPRFTYHGFRYVEVTGYPGVPDEYSITGVVIYTDMEEAGGFKCSNTQINRIHTMIRNTFVANLHGIPTDCPVREKCGWLGDAMIICDSVMYNWDSALFWRKYIEDIGTSRVVNGRWTNVSPGKRTCGEAAPAWGTAQIEIPWRYYLFYDDRQLLERVYPEMSAWVDHLHSRSNQFIVTYGIDDWWPPGSRQNPELPVGFISTAYFYQSVKRMESIARILERKKDADAYGNLMKQVKRAFNNAYFQDALSGYGTQTGNAFALFLGLVPEGREQQTADRLAEDIRSRGNHLTTGHIGVKYVFEALTNYGHGSVAQAVLDQTDYPSFGHQLSMGATTLWESWEGYKILDGIKKGGSLSHPFKGGFDAWFYSHLAGIDPIEPGFKKISIFPHVISNLTYVHGSYESPYGVIENAWSRAGSEFEMRLTIPSNTTAIVRIPTCAAEKVLESGIPVKRAKCVRFLEEESGYLLIEVESGMYSFQSQLLKEGGNTGE